MSVNFIYDHSKHIHQFKWNLSNPVSDGHVSDFELRMVDLFEKEMIFWTVNFGKTVSVSIYLISDWTFLRFGFSGKVWIWLHLALI